MKYLWLCSALLIPAAPFAARPSDPFVLRAVMVNKPRMVLIALEANLSLAYDAPGCGLYMAWRGAMQDGNATYDHQRGGNHGATFYPRGKIVHRQGPAGQGPGGEVAEIPIADTRPNRISPPNEILPKVWTLTRAGQAIEVKPEWQGYTVDNAAETATLRYLLRLPSGQAVRVAEMPEFDGTSGSPGLIRDFDVEGLAAGDKLSLLLSGNPVRKTDGTLLVEEWIASGAGKVETRDGKAWFTAEAPGRTRITGNWR